MNGRFSNKIRLGFHFTASLAILAVSVLVTSCSKGTIMPEEDDLPADTTDQQTLSYLALGDSYTIGEGIEASGRWPRQLTDRIKSEGLVLDSLTIIAKTGWTTSNLISAIADKKPVKHTIVSLLIGVNNQFQRQSFEGFKNEFDSLLIIAQNLAIEENGVFVVSIPDYGVTPFGSFDRARIGEELDMYNAYQRQRCAVKGIPFIDITAISRELGDSEEALADDKLHPSAYQYSLWVEQIAPVVLELLN